MYEPPSASPPPRPHPRLSEIISWIVIGIVVGVIVGLPYLGPPTGGSRRGDDTEMKIMGRYLVGIKLMLPAVINSPQGHEQFKTMVLKAARTSTDKLRAVAVLGELIGKDVALKQLDDFEKSDPLDDLLNDAQLLRKNYKNGSSSLSAEDRSRLIERHQWFAELALSHDRPADDPLRQSALGPARRMVAALVIVFVGGLLGFLAGIVLLILFGIRLATGSRLRMQYNWAPPIPYSEIQMVSAPMPLHYQPDPQSPHYYLEAFAIYLAGFIGLSLLVRLIWPGERLGTAIAAGAVAVVFAVCWPRIRGVSWSQLRQDLGLHSGRGWGKEILCGVAGYIAMLPLLALAVMVTLFLSRYVVGKGPGHPIMEEITANPWSILKLYLLAAVWAPISEETLFRGAFFHHLRRRNGWLLSSLIVSLIFASIHPQGILGVPALMTIAMVLAGLREWRGSLIAPMVLHALNNGIVMTIAILMLA